MRAHKWKIPIRESIGTYNSWFHMRNRCYNPAADQYPYYGGRGIQVCARWRNDYDAFVEDMGLRTERMTIERIDNNGNYEPGNCKWVSRKHQANNRRSNRIIQHAGRSLNLRQWAKSLDISDDDLRYRIKRDGLEKAFASAIRRMEF